MATLHGRVLKYTLLPGIFPRLRALFTSGFSHIAFSIALVYRAVRLLPPEHPYLDQRNFGRYGLRHVIAEAARNLVFSRRNIDQLLIFFTILAGLMLLALQVVLLIVALVAQQDALAGAAAIDPTLTNILGVNSIYGHNGAAPHQDIAFIILDRVFGLQNIYNSCISDSVACTDLNGNPIGAVLPYPFPFHIALHELFRFYSFGIFMVGVIVILYFITAMVGETAVAGSPFGQRFNKTWAPVRLILFFALLVPLNAGGANAGLNGAQLLTFWIAKTGSNFATNAWGRFNDVITGTYLGEADTLVAEPNYPEVNNLVRFMFVVKTCKIAEELAFSHKPVPGKIYPDGHQPNGVQAYVVRNRLGTVDNAIDFLTTDYAAALNFSDNGNIKIAFGVQDSLENALSPGRVKPLCGELVFSTTSRNAASTGFSGAYGMQQIYYQMVQDMWRNERITQGAICVNERIMQVMPIPNCAAWPEKTFAENEITYWSNYIQTRIPAEIARQVANSEWGVDARLQAAGWAGAAIWYNRIAQINGEFTSAIANLPLGDRFPFIMEFIAESNKAKNSNLNPMDVYNPALGGSEETKFPKPEYRLLAAALYKAYSLWDTTGTTTTNQTQSTGSVFEDGVNLIFGTQGIFSMRENADINPLAQLSALGKGMMDAAIRNLGVGFAGGGASAILSKYLGGGITGITKAAADFLFAMGKATIVMSFILYYVLPFMPFMYFFFALSGWIKSIFEAVVAMPLWALAHITRLDGNGLAGPGANNGYFLLLEIFLRPILILIGMIASLSIFSACVTVLNDVFKLLSANLSGFDMAAENAGVGPTEIAFYRGPIDRLFYTAIYVIIVYMMATGYFKLIDQIPNSILRWLGASVQTFGEAVGDPVGQVSGKVFAGGAIALGQVKSGGQLAAVLGVGGGAPTQIPSDPRLKENIVHIGDESGHRLYSFNYKGQKKTFIGVMADEVLRTHPEAVGVIDGYMAVDYDLIGVRFREA